MFNIPCFRIKLSYNKLNKEGRNINFNKLKFNESKVKDDLSSFKSEDEDSNLESSEIYVNEHLTLNCYECKENTDTKFWRIVTKLGWADRSDRICDRYTLNRISREEKDFLRINIITYVRELNIVIEPLNMFINTENELDNIEKYNFLYHIIGKGSLFYRACISDPEFCKYIIHNEEQPLYSILCL